jgi:asparagine synthase (glutamine-hydrolysing)
MCGIAGHIGRKRLEDGAVGSALETMKQRGPDAQRTWRASTGDYHVELLHSRLSIIDLDPRSHQPFELEGCVIAFNGEIYNYVELRQKLTARGVAFRTSSDTEVLLRYYLEYGERCVEHFEGMWAFAIWDPRSESIFLSRDRFAEKPLYYVTIDGEFYFASETKTLRALTGEVLRVDEEHVIRHVINGHRVLHKSDRGFYSGVRELGFATNAIVEPNGSLRSYAYWAPRFAPNERMTFEDAVEGTRVLLRESLRLRLRSDVPLAFCLSGGVDSASLVSIATKEFGAHVHAFSVIDPDPQYDELENIRATVDDTGCTSHLVSLKPGAQNIDRLVELIRYHDAPVATISYLVHSMLSEAISKEGFKISLSGTAADEIFTGYYDHFLMHLHETRGTPEHAAALDAWTRHVKPLVRHPDLSNPNLFESNPGYRDYLLLDNDVFRSFLRKDFREDFSETTYSDSLLRNRMTNELFHEVVRVILHEDDLNSMQYSIENRSPFLDSKLYEFASTIPSRLLIGDGYGKHVLRTAMKGTLNDKVRLAREKKGFNASITSIFDFSDPAHRDFFLSESKIFEWFDRSKISSLLSRSTFSNSYKKFLFGFICAKVFLDQSRDASS